MANDRVLTVKFTGETKDLEKSATKAIGIGSGIGSMFGNLAAKGIEKGVDAVKDFASNMIGLASDAEQSVGGVQAVFKQQADRILASSEQSARGLGLAKTSYQELATVLGAGLKNKGITDFAGQTENLIALGADLAAQYGGPTSDAVSAISSLMRGEADPIERFGVAINETAVNAELAARGQDKLTGAALETAKAQARLDILFRQTADAQGAFSREADTFAAKQQVAAAQWEELQTSIGGAFLPALTAVMGFVSDTAIPGLEQLGLGVQGVADIILKGDYTGGLFDAFGWEEDHPAVAVLFSLRDAGIQVWDKMQEVGRGISEALQPAGDPFYEGPLADGLLWIADELIPSATDAFTGFVDEATRVVSWARENGDWLGPMATGVGVLGAAMGGLALVGYVASLGGLNGVLAILQGRLTASTIAVGAKQAAMLVASGASKAFAAGQWLVNAALSANPIGIVVLALAGLVTAFVIAYNSSEDFRRIVDGAWQGVRDIAERVVGWFTGTALPSLQRFGEDVGRFFDVMGKGIGAGIQWGADRVNEVQNWWTGTVQPNVSNFTTSVGGFFGEMGNRIGEHAQTGLRHLNGFVDWLDANGLPGIRGFVDRAAAGFKGFVDAVGVWWGSDLKTKILMPVSWLSDNVLNPLLSGVEKVASAFGINLKLPRFSIAASAPSSATAGGRAVALADGGMMPGYTPGRDVHTFFSPTAGYLHLSGGEPVLRPEWGRVLGASTIDSMNAAARAGGTAGVMRYMSQGYSDGGIIGKALGALGSGALPGLDPMAWILEQVGKLAGPVRDQLGGGAWAQALTAIPGKIGEWAVEKIKGLFGALAPGGQFTPGNWPVARMGVVSANTRAAVDYVRQTWGIGNIGTLGARPNKSDHPMGKALDVMIPNWQSSGVGVGNAIASWFVSNPNAFGTKLVIWRDQYNRGSGWRPYTHPLGPTKNPTLRHMDHVHVSLYDDGGMLPPGLNLVRNDTGRPEPVLTGRQWDVLTSAVRDRGRPTIQIQRLTITAEEAKRLTVDDVARMIHAELDTLEEMVL